MFAFVLWHFVLYYCFKLTAAIEIGQIVTELTACRIPFWIAAAVRYIINSGLTQARMELVTMTHCAYICCCVW